jgi:hypothetical protein
MQGSAWRRFISKVLDVLDDVFAPRPSIPWDVLTPEQLRRAHVLGLIR